MLNYQDNIERELREQYAIQQQAGYSYKNPADLDKIFSAQAAKLAAAGVQSIYDIGTSVETTGIQRPGYKPTVSEMTSVVDKKLLGGFDQPTQVKTTFLINKKTGEKIPEVELPSNWETADINEFKFKDPLKLAVPSDGTYYRYDKDTSVEGQADYGLEFVDGLPVFRPYYKGTTSDPGLLFAATALVASGLPILAEAALAPEAATAGEVSLGAEAGAGTGISGAGLTSAEMAALKGAEAYGSLGAPISTAVAVPASQLAYPATQIGAGATPVPGSFQATLGELGVQTAATMAPATAVPGSFQAALPSLLTAGGTGLSLLDGLETGKNILDAVNAVDSLLNPPSNQIQLGQEQPIRRQQSQFSLPAPQQTVVGLLPLAERYRRSLI